MDSTSTATRGRAARGAAPGTVALSDIAVGREAVLAAPRTEPRLCRRLAQLGLRPGMRVTVGARTAGGGRVIHSGTSRYAIDRATLRLMDVLA